MERVPESDNYDLPAVSYLAVMMLCHAIVASGSAVPVGKLLKKILLSEIPEDNNPVTYNSFHNDYWAAALALDKLAISVKVGIDVDE